MTSSTEPESKLSTSTTLRLSSFKNGSFVSIVKDKLSSYPTSKPSSSRPSTENLANFVRPSISETMLTIAQVISKRSTCRRRAVGAVLVDKDNRVLAVGHNGTAKGMQHCTDNPCSGAELASGTGLDLCQAIHAEQNALMFCNDIMKIDKCFVTTSPCVHCVKMLMNTGCKHIIFSESYVNSELSEQLWKQDPTRTWTKI